MAAARQWSKATGSQGRQMETWGPIDFLGPDVTGATLGIIGFGRIGQGLAKRALGFDMHILYFDKKRLPEAEQKYCAQYADLNTLLRESDFVSIHTVLSEETYHLMDDSRLKMMKPSGIPINTHAGRWWIPSPTSRTPLGTIPCRPR
jgi:glyoxylate reductase